MKQNINEIKRMQRIAGLITESEYRESLTNEAADGLPLSSKLQKFIDKSISDAKKDDEFEDLMDADYFEEDFIEFILEKFDTEGDYSDVSQEVKNYIAKAIGSMTEDLESDLRGDLEKVSGQGPILDPIKLKMLVRALKTHGGFIGDKQSYREIADLLASNQLAKAASIIVNLDTSPKEMVWDMMKETYPELWNMLFSGDDSGYIAADRPKMGLPEDLESDLRGDLEKVSGMKANNDGDTKVKILKALFKGNVSRSKLNTILKQLNFQSTDEFENAWEAAGLELDVAKPGEGYTVWSDNYENPGDYIEFINGKFNKVIRSGDE